MKRTAGFFQKSKFLAFVCFTLAAQSGALAKNLDSWEENDARLDSGLERYRGNRARRGAGRGVASVPQSGTSGDVQANLLPEAERRGLSGDIEKESSEPVIGVVTQFESSTLKRESFWGEKRKALGRRIHEHEKLFTVTHEWAIIRLNDETTLKLGPSTQVYFKNWNDRNGDKRLIRKIYVRSGFAWLKVQKAYSQFEPFIIETPFGLTAVRGTEFIVEVSENETPLKKESPLKKEEKKLAFDEMEVHTLAGEVTFSKTQDGLWKASERVILGPGMASLVRGSMPKPQHARRFDVKLFNQYLARAFPSNAIIVDKSLSNEPRAKLAAGIDVPQTTADSSRAIASQAPSSEDSKAKIPPVRTRRDFQKWMTKKKKGWEVW